jgi:pyruvate,orthophosphate dikinase
MTSHAAVVARGMGKCCVAGCEEIKVDEKAGQFKVGDLTIKEGDKITLDGSTGELYEGEMPVVEPELTGNFAKLMEWADSTRKLKVRTNADTPKDAEVAVKFGAEGIGLCRTEHMFFEGDRIKAMREMILSEDVEGRKKALAKLLPYQKADFAGLFKVMGERPVTIRLLDPPLHEFLPQEEKDIQELAKELGVTPEKLKQKIEDLHEFNPMLGHRGCRLGITYPEITEMQARAIFEAAIETAVVPEVMIPLVGKVDELRNQKAVVDKVGKEVMKDKPYTVGTMIEVPRGALTADEVAKEAEFFSFGTNDLTQMTCGFSRDDAAKFLKQYVEIGIYEKDPFQVLDQEGVGKLVEIAVEKGRKTKKDLKIGICGEHGGEPSSVEFCHRAGLNYVSCSPYRVPIARLAAAQAVLKEKK